MSEPRDLDNLLDDDVPPEELDRLRRVDALLRSVPGPPPEVPASLSRAVTAVASAPPRLWTRRRALAAVALAAALSALFFGLGARVAGGEGFDERAVVQMQAAENAQGAAAVLRVGNPDESGNWPLRLEVEGLEPLPRGGYYALWLAKDGKYGATCGSFRMGEGETTAEWTVSYRLADYDEWVVTAYLPDEPRDTERPWLLTADAEL
ncbi:MAG: anti-sigma factor [Actinobacteria bacterium]|nr:anti-sigma factor [Actinomycetota bacterium]